MARSIIKDLISKRDLVEEFFSKVGKNPGDCIYLEPRTTDNEYPVYNTSWSYKVADGILMIEVSGCTEDCGRGDQVTIPFDESNNLFNGPIYDIHHVVGAWDGDDNLLIKFSRFTGIYLEMM